MKILLTGATGLLGRALGSRLRARKDVEFTGLAFSRAQAPILKVDITDFEATASLCRELKPDFVIHAAAERRPDVVDKDPERARKLNVEATANLAKACRDCGARMIYLSTDYVYDGTNPPYRPESPVNPLNEYGKLKLAAELAVAENLGTSVTPAQGLVLRIPMLYGPVERLEESSVTELALYLMARKPCKVDDWSTRYPLHVDDVAAAIEILVDTWAAQPGTIEAAREGNEPKSAHLPLFLLSGPVGITKYGMVLEMAKALGLDSSFVEPVQTPASTGAPRPKDCRMDTSRLMSLGYSPRYVFPDGLGPILESFF
jgi:dTDP-4-dehydrorhamnose reductase